MKHGLTWVASKLLVLLVKVVGVCILEYSILSIQISVALTQNRNRTAVEDRTLHNIYCSHEVVRVSSAGRRLNSRACQTCGGAQTPNCPCPRRSRALVSRFLSTRVTGGHARNR
jgi:hypothetical protein